jgi:hypothetical protein
MGTDLNAARAAANHARYRTGQTKGHYESYFQRGNHPTRPLAFWIRYTIFSPHGRPDDAVGELWAIYFDGETGHHTAVKSEVPIASCRFDPARFDVKIDWSTLEPGAMKGAAAAAGHRIEWDLGWEGGESPLFLLPMYMYEAPLPKAKALVGAPMVTWRGKIEVDEKEIDVDGWIGSQNHNWGSKHTDHYAWGQVCGFDEAPDSFLEVATAQIKLGPVWTPPLTPIALRHEGVEYAMNSPLRSAWTGAFDYFSWRFRGESPEARLEGRIVGRRQDFVGLAYANPPGGVKWCLNSKIAACELTLHKKNGGAPVTLRSENRAAFEILTDDESHGIDVRV